MQEQTEKKIPWKWYVAAVLTGIAVLFMVTLFPIWHWMPIQVTESVTVIAVADVGCVTDAVSLNHAVIIPDCDAKPGDIIEATFYRPAIEQSDYYERLQEKANLVNP